MRETQNVTARMPRKAASVRTDDRLLVAQLRSGDSSGFAALYDRHIDSVFRYCHSRLENRADAKDASQDVFLVLWRRRRDIRLVDQSLLPWLIATARFVTLALIRATSRRGEQILEDAPPAALSVDDETSSIELRASLDMAVAGLSDIDRRVFHLCLEQRLSYAAAAEELGVTHAAVRNRLARLRISLTNRLASRQDLS